MPNNGFEFERYDFSFAIGSFYGNYAGGYRYITRSLDGIHVTTEPNPREGDSPSGAIWYEELKLLRSNAVQSVQEPSTYAMIGLGLMALLGVSRRRQALM